MSSPSTSSPDPSTPSADAPQPDRREPDDSPQRRLVETVQAYEVDPPPPARGPEEEPGLTSPTGLSPGRRVPPPA